jgi:uncharacterized membrane protein
MKKILLVVSSAFGALTMGAGFNLMLIYYLKSGASDQYIWASYLLIFVGACIALIRREIK